MGVQGLIVDNVERATVGSGGSHNQFRKLASQRASRAIIKEAQDRKQSNCDN